MKRLIYLGIVLLIAAPLGSADIFFQPQFSTINVGDPLTVDVMYSGTGAPWLGGYDIDVAYDPAILYLSAVAWPDDYLGVPSLRDALFSTPGPGSVNIAEVSMLTDIADLAAAQSGHDPFRLFALVFSPALTPGVSPLTFTRVELTDGDGNSLLAGNTPAGSVTVLGTSVPEPGLGMLLLLPALAALMGLRKRRTA